MGCPAFLFLCCHHPHRLFAAGISDFVDDTWRNDYIASLASNLLRHLGDSTKLAPKLLSQKKT
jgi:hypothetical protein